LTAVRPNPSVFRFSTADDAPLDRLAAWREVLGDGVHLHLDVEPVDDAPPCCARYGVAPSHIRACARRAH
jgi:hypothetical protein